MYGYIVPNKKTLRPQDFVLYRSFYCGLCCQTGKLFGQLPRFTTNYDTAFLSALVFDYSVHDLVIEQHNCVLNPFVKKAIVMDNELFERLAALNIITAYFKADDGVRDKDGAKYRVARSALKRAYKKAVNIAPDVNSAVCAMYKALNDTEKSNCTSIDRAADHFAALYRDCVRLIAGVEISAEMDSLCYNLGKFTYLADALDDVADDFKDKRYNPFLASFGNEFTTRKEFILSNLEQIESVFKFTVNRCIESFGAIKFTQCYSLLQNVICDGMPSKVDELLKSEEKLKMPKI